MRHRRSGFPSSPGLEAELHRALAAVEQLVAERETLHDQIEQARRALLGLRRQLEAQQAENAVLAQTVRAWEASSAARTVPSEVPAPAAPDPADAERTQRLAADLANVRRQRDAQIAAGVRHEKARLLSELAGVRDSVSMALGRSPDPHSSWHAGLEAVRAQIDAVLHREGATLLGAVGERFDPHLHEAIGTAPGPDPGRIVDVAAIGIVLDDGSVVRPAQVVVSA